MDREEEEMIRKEKVVFSMGEGEAINLENMEDLYAYVRSWGTGEEDGIPFTD